MDSRLGRIVLNFRIEQKLGEGSFGVVYRARHVDLGREVAIKLLRPEHSRDQAAVQRFLREARLVCAIDHPAIVQVENSGVLDDAPFYVMELVHGRSLARRIADDGPLTAAQLAVVFREVASALEAAHAKGVIHRDLKPHNLMVIEDGAAITEVKLCDFGIAKLLDSADSGSQTGGMMGTPHFMAPEQARDAKNVDVRADVYGFGATFFAAATGHRPFEGDSVTEVLLKVQQDPPPPLGRYLPQAPPALGAVVDRCLAKAPQERPRSVREAADLILAQLAVMPPTAVAPRIAPPRASDATLTARPTGATGATGPSASGADPLGSTEMKGSLDRDEPVPRRTGRTAAIAVAAIAAVAAAIYVSRPGAGAGVGSPAAVDAGRFAAAASDAGASDAGAIAAAASDAGHEPDAAVIALAPPDAPIAAPAEPVPVRRRPHAPPERKPPVVAPAVVAPPVVAPPAPVDPRPPAPVAPPVANCGRADFAAIYEAAAPSQLAVRAAIRHLRACRDAGVISAAEYDRYQTALVAKL